MKVGKVKLPSEDAIKKAENEDVFNEAILIIQLDMGIDYGDDAGIYFSGKTDEDGFLPEWEDKSNRRSIIDGYVKYQVESIEWRSEEDFAEGGKPFGSTGLFAEGGKFTDQETAFLKKVKEKMKEKNKWHFFNETVDGREVYLKLFAGKKEIDVQRFRINGIEQRMNGNYGGVNHTYDMIAKNFDPSFAEGGKPLGSTGLFSKGGVLSEHFADKSISHGTLKDEDVYEAIMGFPGIT